MNNFFKTSIGKTILFIIINLLVTSLALSFVSITIMIKSDFYTRTYNSLHEEVVDGILEHNCSEIVDNFYQGKKVIDDGNIVFKVEDHEGNILLKSNTYQEDSELEYFATFGEDSHYQIKNSMEEIDSAYEYLISMNIDDKLIQNDYAALVLNAFNLLFSLRYSVYVIAIVSLILLIISFVKLMSLSGKRNGDDLLHPGLCSNIPLDLLIGIAIFIIVIEGCLLDYSYREEWTVVWAIVLLYTILNLLLGLANTIAYRIKTKQLLKNTIIYKLCVLIVRLFKKISNFICSLKLIKKTVLGLLIYMLISVLLLNIGLGFGYVFNIVLTIYFVILVALNLKTLESGGEKIASGDFDYKIDTRRMFGNFKKQGENLNNISSSLELALNEKLKSERTKTELITNVSHDIKTPLTSIINYASLIESEEDPDKIKEYSDVLIKQSEKLKKLIEDLIEASKASSGNLEINLSKCDASEFLKQIAGEYEDKFREKGIEEVCDVTNKKLYIMADGNRMWRVFDNLMNNIYKYALDNTRVYLSLEKEDDMAVFTFKNTSEDKLNISPDELMERFTRGDSSRNTSGNGLGLSIAKSISKLQGGDLEIQIDGDLFKAILKFPLVD